MQETRFEEAIRKNMFRNKCKRVLIAMEPSGLYWYALYNRLKSCGYGVCLVNCRAVKNNRGTMQYKKICMLIPFNCKAD